MRRRIPFATARLGPPAGMRKHAAPGDGWAKRKKKRPALTRPKRATASRRRAGFGAFEVKTLVDDGDTTAQKIEVVAPETGIHSKVWALDTKLQSRPLLNIPLEIRNDIYAMLLQSHDTTIMPQKHGLKFVNAAPATGPNQAATDDNIIRSVARLSLVSRQMYIEVIGGALLHRVGKFSFASPNLMYNYLGCINPFHASSITTLYLRVRLTVLISSTPSAVSSIPSKVFHTLSTLPSLKHLSLEIRTQTNSDSKFYGDSGSFVGSFSGVQEFVCAKMGEDKRWELLRGLKSFEMRFAGTHGLYSSAWLKKEALEQEGKMFGALVDGIRKVVMRT